MQNKPAQPRQMPALLALLWVLIWGLLCWFMLISAIAGLGCLVLGLVSLFVDLSRFLETSIGGEVARTTTQKILFAAVGAVMAGCGIGFWWLSWRGHVGRALICCAVLLGLFLAVAVVTGQGDVIGVGGPAH